MTKTATTKAKTATCRRCKATLRATKSVTAGIGTHCAREERREAAVRTAGFKPATVEKARQLIADKGIVPVRGRRIFQVVSSDGTATYKTSAQVCNCPAGLKAKHACYHRAAAAILTAA